MPPVYVYRCEACDRVFNEIVQYDNRDCPQPCPECDSLSPRTWQDSAPIVLRTSFQDGHRRFDEVRAQSKLKQEKAKARARGDGKLLKEVTKEIKDRVKK